MRIAISGYGRMGKLIYSMLREEGKHQITAVIDPFSQNAEITNSRIDELNREVADAVIDFTTPDAVRENVKRYIEIGMPAVIGTTGASFDDLQSPSVPIITSGNFSIGVSLFISLVKKAGELVNTLPSYDAAITEIHHKNKADSPSGTALMAADALISVLERKNEIVAGNPEGKIRDNQLQISSLRVGSVPGEHSLILDSDSDTITITHTARNRNGFASGAIKAAEWIITCPPGFYTMDDFISNPGGFHD